MFHRLSLLRTTPFSYFSDILYSNFQVGAVRYPQCRNHPRISCTEIDAKALTHASSKAGKVRGLRDRGQAFTLDQQFSLGFRSGEEVGRNRTYAPTASLASSISSSLWIELLSITTLSPRFRMGANHSST